MLKQEYKVIDYTGKIT